MPCKVLLSVVVGVLTMASGVATAQAAADDQSSFTITVTIPPLAATMAAQQAGAVGAWTVFGQGNGFLVETGDNKDGAMMTLHNGQRNRFKLMSAGQTVMPVSIRDSGGLTARQYRSDGFEMIGRATSRITVSAL